MFIDCQTNRVPSSNHELVILTSGHFSQTNRSIFLCLPILSFSLLSPLPPSLSPSPSSFPSPPSPLPHSSLSLTLPSLSLSLFPISLPPSLSPLSVSPSLPSYFLYLFLHISSPNSMDPRWRVYHLSSSVSPNCSGLVAIADEDETAGWLVRIWRHLCLLVIDSKPHVPLSWLTLFLNPPSSCLLTPDKEFLYSW